MASRPSNQRRTGLPVGCITEYRHKRPLEDHYTEESGPDTICPDHTGPDNLPGVPPSYFYRDMGRSKGAISDEQRMKQVEDLFDAID